MNDVCPSASADTETQISSTFGAEFRRSATYCSDYVMITNRRYTCENFAGAGLPTYCCRFNAILNAILNAIPYQLSATHFQEVAFVFYNLLGIGYGPVNAPRSYATLAQFMHSN